MGERYGLILERVDRGLENLELGALCRVEVTYTTRVACGFRALASMRVKCGTPGVCLYIEVEWEGTKLKTTLTTLLKTRLFFCELSTRIVCFDLNNQSLGLQDSVFVFVFLYHLRTYFICLIEHGYEIKG